MIEVKSLHKRYGSINAVNGVSFSVKRGDILGFLGPNGAGKSTTMKMITGFISPSEGTVFVDGKEVGKHPVAIKELIGYLPENGPVYGEMTVEEFLHFIGEIRGYSDKTEREGRIDRVCDLCRLNTVRHQTIETLSKGYKQRVGFAQAVLHDPPILILDEPTDGLDPNQKQEVRKIIKSMARDKAIILSTHILEEVEALCNRVIIIAKGIVIADDTPKGLVQRNQSFNALKIKFKEVNHEEVLAKCRQLDVVASAEFNDGYLEVYPMNRQNIETELLQLCQKENWPLITFDKMPAHLNSVFWELTS